MKRVQVTVAENYLQKQREWLKQHTETSAEAVGLLKLLDTMIEAKDIHLEPKKRDQQLSLIG